MDVKVNTHPYFGNFIAVDVYGIKDDLQDYQTMFYRQYMPEGYMTNTEFLKQLEDGTYHLRLTRLSSCD